MNSTLKSVLLGLGLGLFPLLTCVFLYLVTPYLVSDNPGALLSFAILGLYVVASVGVFVASIILLVRKKTTEGSVSIGTLFLQAIAAISYLAGI